RFGQWVVVAHDGCGQNGCCYPVKWGRREVHQAPRRRVLARGHHVRFYTGGHAAGMIRLQSATVQTCWRNSRAPMHWLLLAVLALMLILAASRYPRLAYSLLVVLIAVAAGLYYMSDPPAEGIPRELDTSEVVIENVTMVPYYAGAFRADGNISNRSEHFDLTELVIRFVLEDCPVGSTSDGCTTVSEV